MPLFSRYVYTHPNDYVLLRYIIFLLIPCPQREILSSPCLAVWLYICASVFRFRTISRKPLAELFSYFIHTSLKGCRCAFWGLWPLTWFLSLHPLCGGGDLLFLLNPHAAACFCSHSKTPTRIISKYLQYAYWPWGICSVNFFFAFFSFFNKIQGRKNPIAHA